MSTKPQTKKILIISGRFRSGTSMLWNVFNKLSDYCVWYEPLHPNLLSHIAHVKPREDHLGIDDYWGNYRNLSNLKSNYSPEFGQNRLFLEKHESWPELKSYLDYLIDKSKDKIPVLQFNRMDLRLSWIKNNFPNATIIHLHRKPHPLWVSSRKHLPLKSDKINESHPDAYDLLQWAADLSLLFPVLQAKKDRHSYFRHYFIYKLTKKMAQQHADIQLRLEKDFFNSQNGLKILASHLKWSPQAISIAQLQVQKPESVTTVLKRESYLDNIESQTDLLFESLGLEKDFPSCPLDVIKLEHHKEWINHPYTPELTTQELLNALRFQKDELTALN